MPSFLRHIVIRRWRFLMTQRRPSKPSFGEYPTLIMKWFFIPIGRKCQKIIGLGRAGTIIFKRTPDGLGAVVTYDMNRLQNLEGSHQFFVTLNNTRHIKPESILGRWTYAHPQFGPESLAIQAGIDEIQPQDHEWRWPGPGVEMGSMRTG